MSKFDLYYDKTLKLTNAVIYKSKRKEKAWEKLSWLIGKLDKLDGSIDGWVAGKGWANWTGLSFCYS